MACLEKSVVVAYLAGELAAAQHVITESHLTDCVHCMGMLSELTQKPEERAVGAIAANGGFIPAVTERLPIGTDPDHKIMWLARHYNLQIGDLIDEKYRIESVLGEGGMGIVLLATHVGLREKVALKFMHPTMVSNASHSARFIREARAAVKLRNENVARVLDLGEVEKSGPFIVMEYLAGEDLLQYLKKKSPLEIGESVELIRQAAKGVAAAHGAGIIHRDLKPGNMFLTERQSGGRVLKVLDFGVSKYIEGDSLSMTATNMVVGSPMYMAPEMFESARNASFGSDIWALGVIFYRMLTGRLPFFAESLPEMVAKIHFGKPTPITHWRPDVPPELVQVIDVCLARNVAERFSTATEFLNALAQLPARIRADPHAPTVAVAHLSSPHVSSPHVSSPHVSSGHASEASGRPDKQAIGRSKRSSDPSKSASQTGPSQRLAPSSHDISQVVAAHTVAHSSGSFEKPNTRSPWVFALVGAAASAALFAGIMMATTAESGSKDGNALPTAPTENLTERVAAPKPAAGGAISKEPTDTSERLNQPTALEQLVAAESEPDAGMRASGAKLPVNLPVDLPIDLPIEEVTNQSKKAAVTRERAKRAAKKKRRDRKSADRKEKTSREAKFGNDKSRNKATDKATNKPTDKNPKTSRPVDDLLLP